MQFKNLTTLGKAYRFGDIDRLTYIRQRRELIDAITSGQLTEDCHAGEFAATEEFDAEQTVINDSSQASDQPVESSVNTAEEKRFAGGLKLLLVMAFITATVAVFALQAWL